MDLKTRYVVKGIGKEQVISSKILIHTQADKITKVEDKWDGNLPEGSIAQVSGLSQLFNPLWWIKYTECWAFWLWSFTWETSVWRVRRGLLLWCLDAFYHAMTNCADFQPFAGLPPTERKYRATHCWCSQECGGGCEKGQPVILSRHSPYNFHSLTNVRVPCVPSSFSVFHFGCVPYRRGFPFVAMCKLLNPPRSPPPALPLPQPLPPPLPTSSFPHPS
jgi:hypothetical protein